MKTIHMNALNMDVRVADNVYYFDEGYVPALGEKLRFIEWKHGVSYSDEIKPNAVGYAASVRTAQNECFFYVFYLKQADAFQDIMIRAHEETHAVDRMGALAQLNDRLKSSGFDVNMLDHDYEIRACMGGWYSLVAWGQDMREELGVNQNDREAFEILQKSRRLRTKG